MSANTIVTTTTTDTAIDTEVKLLTLEAARNSDRGTLTREEAAAILGVHPKTVGVGAKDGTIPSIVAGRRVMIPREKFLELFD